MKHTLKKSLAVLLAALMLLGVTAVGAAAAPAAPEKATLSIAEMLKAAETPTKVIIKTMPTTPEIDISGECDLSGLVLEASGGALSAPQTIDYDTAQKRNLQGDNMLWTVGPTDGPEDWVEGKPANVSLRVRGTKYSDFRVTEEINGVKYGEFETQEEIYTGYVDIVLNAVEAVNPNLDMQSAEELLLGQPKAVSIPEPAKKYYDDDYYDDYYYEETERKVFKFIPAVSGKYCFRSNGARYSDEVYTENGEHHSFSMIDPWGMLYNDKGRPMTAEPYYNNDTNGDKECGLNFTIYTELEAGKTYYLKTTAEYCGGDYTVRVDTYDKKLVVSPKEMTIKVGDYVSLTDLIKGTTWKIEELRAWTHYYWEDTIEIDSGENGFTGIKGGTVTLEITAPDGEYADVEVTVKHTFWSWIKYYILQAGFILAIIERLPGGIKERIGDLFYDIGHIFYR